jgi:hypothetical protein
MTTTEQATEQAEGVVVEERSLTTIEDRPDTQLAIFGTNDPVAIVQRTVEIANAIGTAIKAGGMTSNIQGNEYVKIEGWSLLGTMLKVFPRVIRISDLEEDGKVVGYEAEVGLFTQDNVQVGSAIAECSRTESRWSNREPNQIKSMAQTRATGKAFRITFGYVMPMAGFAATPAEEMSGIGDSAPKPRRAPANPKAEKKPPAKKPAEAKAPQIRTVKQFFAWALEAHEYDQAAVYAALELEDGDLDGVRDIGLKPAQTKVQLHKENAEDAATEPENSADADFREEPDDDETSE